MNLVAPSPEFRQDVACKHLGIGTCHIQVAVFPPHEAVQHVIKANHVTWHIRVFYAPAVLDFVNMFSPARLSLEVLLNGMCTLCPLDVL